MAYWKKKRENSILFGTMFTIEDTLYCMVYKNNADTEIVKAPSILYSGYEEISSEEFYILLKNYAETMIGKTKNG